MNKAELVDLVKKRLDLDLSKAEIAEVIDAFIEELTRALKKGDRTIIKGFGSFSTSKRKARLGRNPQTGQPIKIKARKVARFQPGKELKERLRTGSTGPRRNE